MIQRKFGKRDGTIIVKVLLTGGRGFLGTAVSHELLKAGHTVIPFDIADGTRYNLMNRSAVMRAVQYKDAVIHLAGLLGTDELFDNPYDAVNVNVTGTLNVLEACVQHGAQYVGISMPDVFPSIYTATRTCARNLATAYHQAHGIPTAHVQAFNVFGPGQKHGPGHPRKIIPAFATEAWRDEPIIVWGDGNQTVDMIDSQTVGRIFVDALKCTDNQTIEAGTGIEWTVNEVLKYVMEYTESRSKVIHKPMRRGEIPSRIKAVGRGWGHLSAPPTLDLDFLNKTIDSYR